MTAYHKHITHINTPIRQALQMLDTLASDAILFLVDDDNKLLGSLTDGDLRRGFIKGFGFEDHLRQFTQPHPTYVVEGEILMQELEDYKAKNFKIVPVLNKAFQIVDTINFRNTSTIIPADAIIMAGGKGTRLRPLTEHTPKPLLKVGNKPIIEHNIDRLARVGIKNIHISINYLGDQLVEYFGDGSKKALNISYVREAKPLGTIGSILLVQDFKNEDIMVMNSDLLTNIDFADFYKVFKESNADMGVAATPYNVDVPYAVMEINGDNQVKSLKEKPRYTYFSNAGIYLLKKSLLSMIPQDTFFDITDLMDKILEMNLKLVTFPINGYWLDIGKPEDYKKAQEDIKHIKL